MSLVLSCPVADGCLSSIARKSVNWFGSGSFTLSFENRCFSDGSWHPEGRETPLFHEGWSRIVSYQSHCRVSTIFTAVSRLMHSPIMKIKSWPRKVSSFISSLSFSGSQSRKSDPSGRTWEVNTGVITDYSIDRSISTAGWSLIPSIRDRRQGGCFKIGLPFLRWWGSDRLGKGWTKSRLQTFLSETIAEGKWIS